MIQYRRPKISLLSEVKAYTRYWQKALRLTDWTITPVITYNPEDYGCSTIKPMQNSVLMEILDPEYMDESHTAIHDPEVTVVHELLHLRFFYCTPKSNGKFQPHLEQAIETTAIAMVAARRNISIKEIK
jgi:hypothetical protein